MNLPQTFNRFTCCYRDLYNRFYSIKCRWRDAAVYYIWSFSDAGHCKHRYPTADELPRPIHLGSDRLSKREAEHQLRIEVVFDGSVEKLDAAKKFVVKEKVRVGEFPSPPPQALKWGRRRGINLNQWIPGLCPRIDYPPQNLGSTAFLSGLIGSICNHSRTTDF